MTNYFFDATHPLPAPGANALVALPDAGTTFVGIDIVATTGIALQTALKQRVMIAETFKVQGNGDALASKGIDSAVYNEGFIVSQTGSGIHFSGGGTGLVTNHGTVTGTKGIDVVSPGPQPSASDKLDIYNIGTIAASGLAIEGAIGADRVTNAGLIKTTGADTGVTIMNLGAGNDFYDGTQGTVIGKIDLGSGDDTAYGGAATETFIGGLGSNYMDGGAGNDAVDYSWATTAVSLSLATSGQQWTGTQFDQVLNIESIIGSALNDRLTGNDSQNTLKGGGGDDTLEGGLGNDSLDGGEGNDIVRYAGSSPVTVSLAVAGGQDTGLYGSDTLAGIENLEGGSGSDKLTGNDANNKLIGGGNNDTLTGGLGNDTLEGGTGENRAVYTGDSSAYTIAANADGTFRITGADGEDLLKDIRFAQFADKTVALVNEAPTTVLLSTSSVFESAAVNASVATLYGFDPENDTLSYSLVSDAGGMFAIEGSNLVLKRALDYETAKQHSLVIRAADPYGKELLKTVTLNVRNVVEKTPLVLTGTGAKDSLAGESGDDRISGLVGNDTLWGEAGNDTLIGGTGNDALIGGAGRDVFVLDARPNVRTNVDTIYDFTPLDDTLDLSRKIFTKLSNKGVLTKSAFWVGEHVHDASDRIVYSKKTGALFYDPDGTGKASAIQIASLQKGLKLTYHDFVVI